MIVNELKVKLHASLDPYNTTEEMELNWYNTAMDWTNGKFIFLLLTYIFLILIFF
jgi:hypothetical protein